MTQKISKKCFDKVLIANRGEIAMRILNALDALHIASLAIFHHQDRNAPWVQGADQAIEIVGDPPSAAHLDIEQIVSICLQNKVDAVHPGYGFLSENAEFARSLQQEGICFIGPNADAIELMGDKIRSRDFVASRGFPVPPSVILDAENPNCIGAVAHMPYPLVVKASAGGGGKGMSIVHSPDELQSTLRVAASEAKKYFGDSRIYVERYFSSARHIEVQILGDGKKTIHLGERECSIQRRFQKIVEEAPSPALTEDKRHEICEVAVGIANAANYNSAGTIEFLYTPEGEFYFLEMNTRIQVEHPVTEMIYGFDLVQAQIHIAASNPINMDQQQLSSQGHALECRICAEDAFGGFLPETGKVLHLHTPSSDDNSADSSVRVDSGLYTGQIINTSFDPMLAKLVVHAKDRCSAIKAMKQALSQLVILGVRTNIDYLSQVIDLEEFQRGEFDTAFLQKVEPQLRPTQLSDRQIQTLITTAFLTDQETKILFKKTPSLHAEIGEWIN